MTTTQTHTSTARGRPVGPLGRLGRWTATHFATVVAAWVVLALGLGVPRAARRAPRCRGPAGRRPAPSPSQARQLIDAHFAGAGSYGQTVVVHAPRRDGRRPRVPAGAAARRGARWRAIRR